MTDNLLGDEPTPKETAVVVTETEPTPTITSTSTESVVQAVPSNPSTPSSQDTPAPVSTIQVTNVAQQAVVQDYNAITDSLLDQIGDLGTSSNFKMMIFGYPGRSKSSFLGTAPNNLIYDFEDGLIAAKTAYVNSGRPLADNVKSLGFTDLKQADDLIDRLQADDPRFAAWKVFSVDTISTMHKRMLEYVMRREKAKRPSMNEFDPQTEHYTEVNEVLTRFVQGICDIKSKDIIVLAHAQTVEPKGKPAKTYADFSEKLYNKLAAKMDVVAYVEMGEFDDGNGGKKVKPYFRVQSEGTIQCKSRIPLPPEILDPTWPQFKEQFEKARALGTLQD